MTILITGAKGQLGNELGKILDEGVSERGKLPFLYDGCECQGVFSCDHHRCSNNYGPYQFPEKLIPLMINNCLNKKSLPVYGDGMQIRDWLYVEDHCNSNSRPDYI